MADSGKTKKILLGIGGGCMGLVLLCCLSGYIAYYVRQSSVEDAARAHAEQFLNHVQAGDWEAVHRDVEYDSGYSSYSLQNADSLRTCYGDTAIGDLTSFECDAVSVSPMDDAGDVECTVTSASRGSHEVTIHVNSAQTSPYVGFTWFDDASAFGTTWASDACTLSSGREFFEEPPSNRVRP